MSVLTSFYDIMIGVSYRCYGSRDKNCLNAKVALPIATYELRSHWTTSANQVAMIKHDLGWAILN